MIIRGWACSRCILYDNDHDLGGRRLTILAFDQPPLCEDKDCRMMPVLVCREADAVQFLSANPAGMDVRPEPLYAIPAPEES